MHPELWWLCSYRHTELLVQVPASQTSVGLHCFNLSIHRVTVNGTQAQVRHTQLTTQHIPAFSTTEQLQDSAAQQAAGQPVCRACHSVTAAGAVLACTADRP